MIAGFSVDADLYPDLARRVLGAKGTYFPKRGAPQRWEIKSGDLIRPNPWKRAVNRHFVDELLRIVSGLGITAYAVTIPKARMHHALTLATTMPLQLQALVGHFDAECRALALILQEAPSETAEVP